jgi:RecB family exonuclease
VIDLPVPVATPPEPPVGLADAPFPPRESHSSIATYEGCPLRYANRYLLHVRGEDTRAWYGFGSAIHAAFEAFDRARIAAVRDPAAPKPGLDTLAAAFEASIARSGCDPDLLARWRDRADAVLRRYVAREAAATARPIAVEQGFGLDLAVSDAGAPVRFVGYVDRVDRRADGGIELLDHKTGWVRSQVDVDADRQLTAYAFAFGRGAVRDPDDPAGLPLPVPARLGLHFADAGVTVWTQRTQEQLAAFGDALEATIRRIRSRELAATPGPACRWCEYRATCPESAAAA